jgi:hypothetical protein
MGLEGAESIAAEAGPWMGWPPQRFDQGSVLRAA